MVLDLAAESRRRRVEAFFADAPDDDVDLEAVLEQARFAAAQHFDPTLTRSN